MITILGVMTILLATIVGQRWVRTGSMYRPSQMWGYILASMALNERYEIHFIPLVKLTFICFLVWVGISAIWWEYTSLWSNI